MQKGPPPAPPPKTPNVCKRFQRLRERVTARNLVRTADAVNKGAVMPSEPHGGRFVSSPFYVLRGAQFLWYHSTLWKYAAAPFGISVLALSIGYYVLYRFFVSWVGGLVGEGWYWQALYYVVIVIVACLVLVVFFFLFTLLATVIAAPFNELISEKTEQLVTGNFQDSPFSFLQLLKDSARGIGHFFRILGVYFGILIASLFLLLVPGIGPMLFAAAMVLNTSYMLAYEYLGYPMDRRRFTFKQKRRFLRSRLKWTMGFGLGNAALASVPVLNLVVMPAAVVGGTLLFLDLTAATTKTPKMDGS